LFRRLASLLVCCGCGTAGVLAAPAAADFDRLWSRAVLHRGAEGAWLQEFKLLGREQVDWYDFDDGTHRVEGFYNRRTRLGADLAFRGGLGFRLEVDWAARAGAFHYHKLTDCYFRQEWADGWAVTVGKQSTRITLDGATPANQLITIERSAIAWNIGVPEDSVPGLNLERNLGPWYLRVGLFSAGVASPGFGDFSAGTIGIVSVARELAPAGSKDHAVVRFDYLRQGADPQNATGKPGAFTRDHAQVWSLNCQCQHGPWALGVDLAASEGQGAQSDLRGFQLMPSYAFDESWQVVFRYTWMTSALSDGLRFTRYENMVNLGRGDRYEECYLGLNRYFYGHKLKWMFGLQHTSMQDVAANGGEYHGWGLSSGFRVWW
jgi:phosphate-selective porin OprO/OprP